RCDSAKIGDLEGYKGLRLAGSADELNLDSVVGVYLNYCAEVARAQTMSGKVSIQHDGLEKRKGHTYSGRTVTSLTSSRPESWIHTVRTRAEPMGPLSSPRTVYFRPNSKPSTSETSPSEAIRRTSATKAS